MLSQLKKDLAAKGRKEKVAVYSNFFKTGKGQYGEGDIFIGSTVPDTRSVASSYKDLPFFDIRTLLHSKIHEERLCALLILVYQFQKGNNQKKIYEFYLKNTKRINNWDLVDSSADKIVGCYLFEKDKKILCTLARSSNLWERRIAIIATFYFIRNKQFEDTLVVSEILLQDKHDLIHKAVGWMLREVGKRDQNILETFLKKYYKIMPRTMLRYSIEKFSDPKKKFYMS